MQLLHIVLKILKSEEYEERLKSVKYPPPLVLFPVRVPVEVCNFQNPFRRIPLLTIWELLGSHPMQTNWYDTNMHISFTLQVPGSYMYEILASIH